MTKTEIRDSLVKQLELRGMNAEFYKDMIDDYVYYWSLKKKLISDIKSKGLRYKTINGNGVEVEKTNDSVVNLQKTTATMLKILADLRLKDPVPEPEKQQMVICKEIDDYLKYVKEHPKWINKKRKQLIKNIVKPLLKRNDIFSIKRPMRIVSNTAK